MNDFVNHSGPDTPDDELDRVMVYDEEPTLMMKLLKILSIAYPAIVILFLVSRCHSVEENIKANKKCEENVHLCQLYKQEPVIPR